jgi:hypothetical protein
MLVSPYLPPHLRFEVALVCLLIVAPASGNKPAKLLQLTYLQRSATLNRQLSNIAHTADGLWSGGALRIYPAAVSDEHSRVIPDACLSAVGKSSADGV